MPLKIIGAGFGRTGTLSTSKALNELGFPCYHMAEVIANKGNNSHLDFWRRVANTPAGMQHEWETVFGTYTATVDNPGCCVWRELVEAYPQAKVLLTLHPKGADAWYDSTIETIYFTETMWQFAVLKFATPFGRRFGDVARKLIWQRSHKSLMEDRAAALADYNAHIERVKSAVPADRLLIFTADQGWGPLCDFLGVPVPQNPFPNVNDRQEMKKALANMARGAYFILGGAALIVAAVLYGISRLLG